MSAMPTTPRPSPTPEQMERLPSSWAHEERGRWLRAFIAALDLVVVEWPPAEEMEGRP